MPRGMSAPSAVRKLAVGGLIDAALVDCSAMGESSRPSLSMAQELIAQLVDARGARWVQLIEPPRSWLVCVRAQMRWRDRKSTRLNSSHVAISYAVFCWKKKRTLCKATYKKTVSTTFSSKVSFNLYYIIEFIERIACISCTIDPVNDPHSHIYT